MIWLRSKYSGLDIIYKQYPGMQWLCWESIVSEERERLCARNMIDCVTLSAAR